LSWEPSNSSLSKIYTKLLSTVITPTML
jgi:hypothetical protein